MKYIIIKTRKEAFHNWNDAPQEVEFLKNLHRHIFYIEVEISVSRNDRELEFFIVKKELDNYLEAYLNNKNRIVGSCEMFAEDILRFIIGKYPNRKYMVSVFEDNENGARVEK